MFKKLGVNLTDFCLNFGLPSFGSVLGIIAIISVIIILM